MSSTPSEEGRPLPQPFSYFRGVYAELKKVRWPNRKEMVRYTTTVVVVCVILFVLTYAFDLLVTKLFQLIGIGS
ncbi:preprotein translocase subunit SecE [Ferroacidibacillus organovorans]|uniref:preprotein translocase subunit SecE n=1 Tax=Ferroacidibacillus organovorans TaxID=1765683 RepID=UPI000A5A677E|nr:preprotein translocase subunit SecE [Ferroacidibacillus organovorans]